MTKGGIFVEDLFESKIFKKLYEKRLKMIKENHPEYSPEKQRAISYVITKEIYRIIMK